ncbi:hypothetical protein [Burkholderia ubonensis]|uniref:hypothetical protein n=1 Tax=Burkholderia ubonensis TaxID=101571 RepID=UPI0007C6FDE9|nr:hypothetical protein [Burkholderia ubonensis]
MTTENKKSPAPEQASEAVPQRPRTENPTAESIFEQAAGAGNLISSKFGDGKSRDDALKDDQRQALGESISEYFGKLDSDEGIRAPEGRILRAFDYCDSRNIDDLIDREIVPAIAAPRVEQHAGAPADEPCDSDTITFRGDSLTLSGAQLLEALDFIAPDRDRDQLESELTFQRGEGHTGNGMYCWLSEYPEEGAFFVDGSTAIPAEATLTAEDIAALHVLNEKLRYVDDMGPADEGWQSDKLNAAWKAVDAVLARAQNANKTVTEEATERALTQAIDERDQAEEAGTRLAEAVAIPVEWDQDAAIEALSDFPKGSIWYEFLEEVGFDPTSGPIYVLTVQGRAMLDQLKSAYFAAPQPAQADTREELADDQRQALCLAAINCPHSIDTRSITLHFDDKQPGHNALNQLSRRLEAACIVLLQGASHAE